MNATDVYHQLTEKGQDYHVMGFHVVAVQTKGMQEVSKQDFIICTLECQRFTSRRINTRFGLELIPTCSPFPSLSLPPYLFPSPLPLPSCSLECILTCSGHGSCDWRTKRCVCDTFWMENPIAAYTGKEESTCTCNCCEYLIREVGGEGRFSRTLHGSLDSLHCLSLAHTHAHTHACTHAQTCTHTHTHAHTHTHTCTHAHTCTHTRTHTNTHTHTHIHTHTEWSVFYVVLVILCIVMVIIILVWVSK